MIQPYAGSSAPSGYLLCDGSAVSRSTYEALFAVIGTTYGAGDGSTTFNLPNLKGRFWYGFDSTDTAFDAVGETGGAKTINIQHSHTGAAHTHTQTGTTSANSNTVVTGSDINTNFAPNGHTHSYTYTTGARTASGSDSQLSTTQSIVSPFITLNAIIRI